MHHHFFNMWSYSTGLTQYSQPRTRALSKLPWLEVVILAHPEYPLIHKQIPYSTKERTCFNKRTPPLDFWLWVAVSWQLLIRSWPNFRASTLDIQGFCWQGLLTLHKDKGSLSASVPSAFYSALYGSCMFQRWIHIKHILHSGKWNECIFWHLSNKHCSTPRMYKELGHGW